MTKLSVKERILIDSLIPQKGTYEELSAFLDLKKHIRFTEEECRKFDIHVGTPTTIECECGSEWTTIEPPSAVNGNHQCGTCNGFNTRVLRKNPSEQQVAFNEEACQDYSIEIKMNAIVRSSISKTLRDLSNKGELTVHYLELYERFAK